MGEKKFKNKKIKLLSFQKDLAILLEEYNYKMQPQLQYSKRGIVPINTVDEIPEPPKRKVPKAVSPKELKEKTETGKFKVGNAKQKSSKIKT